MTWDGKQFSPGGSVSASLPGQTGSAAGSNAVTVQDLINLGLIDPGVVSGSGTLYQPATTRFAASVASALEDAASSITLNSATLFKKMNGLAGVVIGSGGIAAYNSAGTATITIDPETGNVTISGTITATAGAIGGFTLGADFVRDAANSFGLASTVTGADDVRVWAGDTFANRASAPVRIYESGAVVARTLTITNNTAAPAIDVGNTSSGNAITSVANTGTAVTAEAQGSGGVGIRAIASGSATTALAITGLMTINNATLVTNLHAATADTLQTARTIGGTSFNGSANITVRALGITDAIPNTLDLQNPTITTGTGVATFDPNNKPAGSSTNTWMAIVVNSTGYFFPVWT